MRRLSWLSRRDISRPWRRGFLITATLCTLLGAPLSHAAGATKLTLWARADDASFLGKLVTRFNTTHSDVQVSVTFLPDASVAQKYSTAAATGSGPDVAATDLATMPYYIDAGWFADLTARAHRLSYFKQLSPAHLSLATYQGKVYGLPLTADVSVLYYNTDLFKRAGLDPATPPTTWAQIEADAKKIRALGKDYYGFYFSGACGGCMAFTFLPYIWASGGNVLHGEGSAETATLTTSAPVTQALTFFHRLWTDGVVPPGAKTDAGASQFAPFESGKVGMFGQGAYPIGTFKSQYPNLHFNATPLPGMNGGWAAYTGGDSIAIPKSTKHLDAAWEFVSWVTSTPAQTYLGQLGVLPIRSDVAQGSYAKADPRFAVLARVLSHGRTPKAKNVSALFFDNNGPWSTMVQQAIFGGNIQQAVQQAQQQFTTILKQG